jgi:hypothetical protein
MIFAALRIMEAMAAGELDRPDPAAVIECRVGARRLREKWRKMPDGVVRHRAGRPSQADGMFNP